MEGDKTSKHKCATAAVTVAGVVSLPGPELSLTGVELRMCFLMMQLDGVANSVQKLEGNEQYIFFFKKLQHINSD